MKAVLDTNVLVSGVLSSSGPPAKLLSGIETGLLVPVFSEPILFEYFNVLMRPKLGLERELVADLMESLSLSGLLVETLVIEREEFPDPYDVPFYAAAMLADCPLVTGNLRHFPKHGPVKVLSPRQALDQVMT